MTRAFLVCVRNDVAGMNVQITDLYPNSSQRNSSLDGAGQTHYLRYMVDRPGATVVSGDSWVSGSKTTSTLSSLVVTDSDGDTTDDSSVTATAAFGLLAYLQDRVEVNPSGDADTLTTGEATAIVNDILSTVAAGNDLTESVIAGFINAACAGSDSDFGDGTSKSFGNVEDVMRILSGEVYRLKSSTILADDVGLFLSLSEREALVAAATGTYNASGGFIARDESGFQDLPVLVLSGAVRSSAMEGQLHGFSSSFSWNNPSFAYAANMVMGWRPRAVTITGSNIPASGAGSVVKVYSSDGTCLS